MNTKVTISKEKYDTLKREAVAWRQATGTPRDTVIFNAARDNNGKGIPAEKFARILRKLVNEDSRARA